LKLKLKKSLSSLLVLYNSYFFPNSINLKVGTLTSISHVKFLLLINNYFFPGSKTSNPNFFLLPFAIQNPQNSSIKLVQIESEMMGDGRMGRNNSQTQASSSSSMFMVMTACLNVGVPNFVM